MTPATEEHTCGRSHSGAPPLGVAAASGAVGTWSGNPRAAPLWPVYTTDRLMGKYADHGQSMRQRRDYLKLILNLPEWVRTYLRLSFFLVRPEVSHLEVGVLSFDMRGDEQWLPWSER